MTSRVLIPVLSGLEQNEKPLVKQVLKGVKQIQHQEITSQSHNENQTSFSFQPPSQNTIIDRQFLVKMKVRVKHTNQLNGFVREGVNGGERNQPVATYKTKSLANCGFHQSTQRARVKKNFQPNVALVAVPPSTISAGGATPSATQIKASVDASLAILNTNIQVAQNANITLLNNGSNAQNDDLDDIARGALIQNGNNFAPRQFPLNSCLDSIDLTINGTHFSVPVNQYIHAVMKYTTPEYREKHLSVCPHAPDLFASPFIGIARSGQNPMGKVGETCRYNETPRGRYLDDDYFDPSIETDTSGTVTRAGGNSATFELTEPLFISPLMASLGHGLTNINNIDIVLRWNSDMLNKMFCLVENSTMSVGDAFLLNGTTTNNLTAAGLTADFKDNLGNQLQAKLLVNYYQAQDDVKIPNEIILPYKQPQIHIKQMGNLNFNSTAVITGDNIRLNQIPDSVYLYAKPKRGGNRDKVTTADANLRITKVAVNWKNQTNILSGYTEDELISLAVDNGLDNSPQEVKSIGYGEGDGAGLVLKLVFGKDIPLDDNESAGTRGDYNWRCDVDFFVNGFSTEYELYQVFIMNGHAIVSPNECRVATGVLDLKDNLDSMDMGHEHGQGAGVVGGSLIGGSTVGGGIGDVMGHLRTVAKLGKQAHSVMKDCGPAVAQAVAQYKSRA